MTEITYFLVSILLFQMTNYLIKKNKVSLTVGFLPFLVYFVLTASQSSLWFISICSAMFLLVVGGFWQKKDITLHFGISTLSIFWFLSLTRRIDNFLELGLIIIAFNLNVFIMGGHKYFRSHKLLKEESNFITTSILLLIGLITVFFVSENGTSLFNLITSDGEKLTQSLLLVYVLFTLKGFGPTSLEVYKKRLFDSRFMPIKNFVNLVVIPSVLCIYIKPIIFKITVYEMFLPITLMSVVLYFIVAVKRNLFDIRSYAVSLFHVITISLLYLFVGSFSSLVLVGTLSVNFITFQYMALGGTFRARGNLYDLLFVGGPVSPVFYIKLYYLSFLLPETTVFLGSVLLIYMFTPLLLYPFFNYKGVACE